MLLAMSYYVTKTEGGKSKSVLVSMQAIVRLFIKPIVDIKDTKKTRSEPL